MLLNQVGDVGAELLGVVGMVEPVINDVFATGLQPFGKRAHGFEEGDDLLDMMLYIIGFLAHFGDEIDRVVIVAAVPGMFVV